ncbi:hypothetical protein T439DRAFT_188985 [Meredithblackwellia eburnea MCA 4105]
MSLTNKQPCKYLQSPTSHCKASHVSADLQLGIPSQSAPCMLKILAYPFSSTNVPENHTNTFNATGRFTHCSAASQGCSQFNMSIFRLLTTNPLEDLRTCTTFNLLRFFLFFLGYCYFRLSTLPSLPTQTVRIPAPCPRKPSTWPPDTGS